MHLNVVPPPPPSPLSHQEGAEVARPAVQLHAAGVADGDKEAVGGLQEGRASLVQGEEAGFLTLGPADAPGGFHQQDGHRVGTHLQVAMGGKKKITKFAAEVEVGALPLRRLTSLVGANGRACAIASLAMLEVL